MRSSLLPKFLLLFSNVSLKEIRRGNNSQQVVRGGVCKPRYSAGFLLLLRRSLPGSSYDLLSTACLASWSASISLEGEDLTRPADDIFLSWFSLAEPSCFEQAPLTSIYLGVALNPSCTSRYSTSLPKLRER